MAKNLIYAQSGGATAVINVTARALIEEAQKNKQAFGKILCANGGITGILKESIFDVTDGSAEEVRSIENEPGAFFGTCRYKLADPDKDDRQYRRIYEVFKQHNIGYFFYNGGNDSQDTTNRIATWCRKQNLDVQCIGIPKTVDNDLAGTDTCPGFGTVAKYINIAVNEVHADLLSISGSSTKVFVLETMGRNAGWIAASAGLSKQKEGDPPHIILVPEVPFNKEKFLAQVKHYVETFSCCLVVASEGIKDEQGEYLTASKVVVDGFGHQQLGGVAPIVAGIVKEALGYKYHWAVPDYMQRASKHIVSSVDYAQAEAVGKEAIKAVLAGKTDMMIGIKRLSTSPFKWGCGLVPLQDVANVEKALPLSYLSEDKRSLSKEGRDYFQPLIQGETYPAYSDGMLMKGKLSKKEIAKALPDFEL